MGHAVCSIDAFIDKKWTQLVSKFFAAVYGYIGVRHLTTFSCHPQTSGQLERSNKTIIALLRSYVAEHESGWDQFVQSLTYGYKAQGHRLTETIPLILAIFHHPMGPAVSDPLLSIHTDMSTPNDPCSFCNRFLRKLVTLRARTNQILEHAEARYNHYFSQGSLPPLNVATGPIHIFRSTAWTSNVGFSSSTRATKSKLLSKIVGPLGIIPTTPDMCAIDKTFMHNKESLDHVIRA